MKIKTRNSETNIVSIYEFVYSTSLNLVNTANSASDLFAKTIKFFPKYVIVNHLDTHVRFRQYQYELDQRILEPNERQILYWPSEDFASLLSVKTFDKDENADIHNEHSNWSWTQGIPIKMVGIVSVISRSSLHPHLFKLIRIEKRLIESTVYIIIDKEDIKHPTYMIENCSKGVSMMMYQKGCED